MKLKKHLTVTSILLTAAFLISSVAYAMPKAAFQGKPTSFKKGSVRGAAVWHDNNGQHIRFTTKGKLHRFHGKICASGKIKKMNTFRIENSDSIKLGSKGKCIYFNFKTKDHIDGFDFRAPTGQKIFYTIKIDGRKLSRKHIWLGKQGSHPRDNTFTLNRNR